MGAEPREGEGRVPVGTEEVWLVRAEELVLGAEELVLGAEELVLGAEEVVLGAERVVEEADSEEVMFGSGQVTSLHSSGQYSLIFW